MTRLELLTTCALAMLLAACDKSPPPVSAPPPEPLKDAPAPDKPATALVMPDACKMLDAAEVASAAGWKSAKAEKVDTGAVYLAACRYVDASDPKHVVTLNIAYGALIPDDSANYAQTVGDMEGALKQPATPVTTYGVPAIEMDRGPGAQSIQTRFQPTTELTVTTPSMQTTRVLFPRALINLRKLPELQLRNDS
jgi:hypothetical protein